ncbi:hypothetical protein [Fluviispira sanaruensis]|nr:hypothetical protein [Fluviispira sanaruensis]
MNLKFYYFIDIHNYQNPKALMKTEYLSSFEHKFYLTAEYAYSI